jgi:hypothetical protein
MGEKLKKIGWQWGIDGIEEKITEYGERDSCGIPVRHYPSINEFVHMGEYESYIDALIQGLKRELSHSKEELATLTMAFKFNPDERLREMNFVRFIFNLIMWRPYIVYQIPVTEKDIFCPEIFHNKRYAQYFDNFAEKHRGKFTMAEFSEVLYEIQIYMNKIAVEVGPLFGDSISIYDMVKMAKRNTEIDSIINTEIDIENFKVREVEEFLIGQTERMFQILSGESDKNNPLKPFIRAGVGVNKRQFQEVFIHSGFKPDLQGNTIPLTTNTNFMTEGLKTPESLFVDSKGARKAAIMQLAVSDSGYYGRHQTFATSDVTLHEDQTHSCDTVNLLKVKIENKRDLEIFEGRFYKVGEKKYKIITLDDIDLLGKDIEVRSPQTCATKTNKICKTCYGHLYNINYGMHAGLYSAIDTNESKTQLQLSARHALATLSTNVEMYDENMFLINQNGWLFTLNGNIDRDKYEIVFNTSEVKMENQDNYDKYDNYLVSRLVFRNKFTKEEFEVYEMQATNMYFSKQLYKALRDKKFFNLDGGEIVTIPLSKLSVDEPFVFLRITNEELAKPLKELSGFIQKGKKQLLDMEDYHTFIYKLNSLFRYGGMSIPSVHIEMLSRNLVRRKDDDLNIPDWGIPQTPDMYKMVSLNEAILLTNSVVLGMMFEKVKKQLRNPKTYKKRGTSIYSPLFVNE